MLPSWQLPPRQSQTHNRNLGISDRTWDKLSILEQRIRHRIEQTKNQIHESHNRAVGILSQRKFHEIHLINALGQVEENMKKYPPATYVDNRQADEIS